MPLPLAIRQFYAPVQPGLLPARAGAAGVAYQEFAPAEPLRPLVYCYWQLHTGQPLAQPFVYRVVADGCVDVYHDLSQPGDAYITGFCPTFTEFSLGQSFFYWGIRFLPGMLPVWFGLSAAELSPVATELSGVLPGLAAFLRGRLHPGLPPHELAHLTDAHLLNQLNQAKLKFDPRFYRALALLLQQRGAVALRTDLDTGFSPRQMRRQFAHYIGHSAKTFCQVVRFQNLLRAVPSAQELRQQKLFFDFGYYDQAHFSKEFKHFYGLTPRQAFGGE
ncbi:MAG: helix-turn-helix domain-containing protein [Bernardetiaceae bacterium]|jgi:AraC-like DNA-binding protein|nr:helix-turn-helix domain-containing protein [Bernardetiaceae bacterium]